MKRLFTIFLAIIYFAVSTGFSLHQHVCMGSVVDASFQPPPAGSHACSKCGMETRSNRGCCSHKQTILKISDDNLAAKQLIFATPHLPAYPPSASFLLYKISAIPLSTAASVVASVDLPPPLGVQVFLRNQNFRI